MELQVVRECSVCVGGPDSMVLKATFVLDYDVLKSCSFHVQIICHLPKMKRLFAGSLIDDGGFNHTGRWMTAKPNKHPAPKEWHRIIPSGALLFGEKERTRAGQMVPDGARTRC